MIRHARVIAADFWGLCRVCGIGVALRWMVAVLGHFGACRQAGNLQPADAAMGDGPFNVRLGGAKAVLCGLQVITGIREIWVRDPYLGNNFLTIPADGLVVDLGANMGVFTAMALGQGPGVRVVAVEADPAQCRRLEPTLAANGGNSRARVINAFVGGSMEFQNNLKATDRGASVPVLSEEEFLARIGGGPVDLLKCDIEGSEFALFAGPGILIGATRQIAMELHPDSGDAEGVIEQLKGMGFEVRVQRRPPTILVRGRRGLGK